jgi:antitoxin VapB
MALSIKNEEAERLARELAKETDATITAAVIVALKESLRRLRGRKTVPSVRDAILELSDRCAALPDLDDRTPDEILAYDEDGGFA